MYGCEKLKTISRNISKLENLEVLGLSFGDSRDFVYVSRYYLYEAIIKWGPDFKQCWRLRSNFYSYEPGSIWI